MKMNPVNIPTMTDIKFKRVMTNQGFRQVSNCKTINESELLFYGAMRLLREALQSETK